LESLSPLLQFVLDVESVVVSWVEFAASLIVVLCQLLLSLQININHQWSRFLKDNIKDNMYRFQPINEIKQKEKEKNNNRNVKCRRGGRVLVPTPIPTHEESGEETNGVGVERRIKTTQIVLIFISLLPLLSGHP
jgi:hypothetical protein